MSEGEHYKPKKSRKMKIIKAPTYIAAGKALQAIPKTDLQHLLMASGNPAMISISHCMDDPMKNRYTLIELCAMNSVSIKDVAQMFKEAKLAEATMKQMEHAPAILETNAVASIGREMPCPTCAGKGNIVEKCAMCDGAGKTDDGDCKACMKAGYIDLGTCRTCKGSKWVQEAGDPNAVKGFLESAGLTRQGGGIHIGVGINQNFSGGAFEDLMRDAERKVIEVKPG